MTTSSSLSCPLFLAFILPSILVLRATYLSPCGLSLLLLLPLRVWDPGLGWIVFIFIRARCDLCLALTPEKTSGVCFGRAEGGPSPWCCFGSTGGRLGPRSSVGLQEVEDLFLSLEVPSFSVTPVFHFAAQLVVCAPTCATKRQEHLEQASFLHHPSIATFVRLSSFIRIACPALSSTLFSIFHCTFFTPSLALTSYTFSPRAYNCLRGSPFLLLHTYRQHLSIHFCNLITSFFQVHPPFHLPHPRLPAPQHSLLLHTSSSSRFLVRSLVSSEDIVSWNPQKLHRPAMLSQCPQDAPQLPQSSPPPLSPTFALTRHSLSVTSISFRRASHLDASFATTVSASKELYLPTTSTTGLLSPPPPHQRLPSSAPRTWSHPFISPTCNPSSLLQCSLRYLSLMCFRIRFLGLGIERITGKTALPRLHPYIS